MDFIAEIRRRHFISDESISSIALSLNLSRTAVRKHLLTIEEHVSQRKNQSAPKLSEFQKRLKQWLKTESHLPKKQTRTAQRLFGVGSAQPHSLPDLTLASSQFLVRIRNENTHNGGGTLMLGVRVD